MKTSAWYEHLRKPRWAPPSSVFGPVWTVLYIGIAICLAGVGGDFFGGLIGWLIVLPFLLNIIANLLFTPLQFGLRSNALACIDIFIVLGTLVWSMMAIFPFTPWIAYLSIPYLLWVCFATCLQVCITVLN